MPNVDRYLLKLSGAELAGEPMHEITTLFDQLAADYGIDPGRVLEFLKVVAKSANLGIDHCTTERIAIEIADAQRLSLAEGRILQVVVVVGGGNLFRGAELAAQGMDRATADHMGMLGTVINALALQSALEQHVLLPSELEPEDEANSEAPSVGIGLACRVMLGLEIKSVAEPFIQRRALRHLTKGRIVVMGGGIGEPGTTTDFTAALRAFALHCKRILIAKSGVPGIHASDPRVDPNSPVFKEVPYSRILADKLKFADLSASGLMMEMGLECMAFSMQVPGNITDALMGKSFGTIVRNDCTPTFYPTPSDALRAL